MLRKGVYIFASLAIVASILLFAHTNSKDKEQIEPTAPAYAGVAGTIQRDSICEILLDFGNVHGAATVTKNIRLTNNTETPVALLDYEATCRCVSVELPDKAIDAGAYVDITVEFDSRGEYGSIGNYVSITTSDPLCNIAVWINADVE